MGKRSRKFPVILTPDMIQGSDCLVEYWESVNVNSSNKYIFAAPSTANSFFKDFSLTANTGPENATPDKDYEA